MAQTDLLKDSQSLQVFSGSEQTAVPPPRRLVVLVPDNDGQDADLAHRIWALAFELRLTVLFLSLSPDPTEEPRLRRRLVTMAASLQDEGVPAEVKIETDKDWPGRLKLIHQPGDIIICHAEQKIGLWPRPLSKALKSDLQAPVYVLSGLYPRRSIVSRFLSEFILWGGSLGIIVGFFWVQVKLDALPKDWAHDLLLYVSVLIEVAAIWFWNSLFN